VLVFELVRQHGMLMLGPILLLAGFLQLVAGRLRLGCWFRVTAPAVVYGMLAGIGVLIVLSQVHVMLDSTPKPSGLDNLAGFPAALAEAIPALGGGLGWQAGLLGLSTMLVMYLWDKLRPQSLRFVPGALLGVGLATVTSLVLALQVKRVEVPENLADAIDWLRPSDLLNLADPQLLIAAFAVAFIASAETLLSAAAVDRMHSGQRSDFDKELSAQGVGNMLCGLVGALPMTGVIVRSSANVQAGATTRLSAMFHGLWLLAFVLLLSSVLQSIPVASLAGVLVYTGIKLVDLKAFRGLARYGRMPMFTYAATALAIIFTDLLTGVLVGEAGVQGVAVEGQPDRPAPGRRDGAAFDRCGDLFESTGTDPGAVDGARGDDLARAAQQLELHRPFLPGVAGGMGTGECGEGLEADDRGAWVEATVGRADSYDDGDRFGAIYYLTKPDEKCGRGGATIRLARECGVSVTE
jgi:MFS superfamily sulfate permease-like transporter